MKTAPAVLSTKVPSLQMSEAELVKVLESSIYPGAQIESIKLVIGYCKANGLDPMQKPVHIVPMSVKIAGTNPARYEYRDVIMPGVGLYRTQAARTQEYVGIDEAQFGETKTFKIDEFELSYPEWCSVVVHRQVADLPRDFSSGKVYWLETYATAGKDTKAPNAMWKKRPFGQIEKCAEAMALRRAFPELGAAPTAEEMQGRTLDPEDDVPTQPALEGPKSKPESESASPAAGRAEPGAGSAQHAEPKPATTRTSEELLNDTKKNLIRRALERASLGELDLKVKYHCGVDLLVNSQFNEVQEWIKANAKAGS